MTPSRIYRRVIKRISRYWLPDSKKKVIHTHVNGYELLVLANEEVGRAVHFGQRYESPETNYLQKIITSNSVCIDIGANIGYFTILMAKTAISGRVYAFEPIPLNASLLRASVELNELDNVEIIESAVGATDGQTTLSQSTDGAYSSIRNTARKAVERLIHVPITTLDTFVRERSLYSIDVLKVDVEGAEGLVLMGSQELLRDRKRKPRVILMELFDENLSSYDTSASALIDIIQGFGYTAFFVNNKVELVPFKSEGLDEFYNVMFLTKETRAND